MNTISRTARQGFQKGVHKGFQQGLGWFVFASGNLAGIALLTHGLTG